MNFNSHEELTFFSFEQSRFGNRASSVGWLSIIPILESTHWFVSVTSKTSLLQVTPIDVLDLPWHPREGDYISLSPEHPYEMWACGTMKGLVLSSRSHTYNSSALIHAQGNDKTTGTFILLPTRNWMHQDRELSGPRHVVKKHNTDLMPCKALLFWVFITMNGISPTWGHGWKEKCGPYSHGFLFQWKNGFLRSNLSLKSFPFFHFFYLTRLCLPNATAERTHSRLSGVDTSVSHTLREIDYSGSSCWHCSRKKKQKAHWGEK